MQILRTPDTRFTDLPDFPFTPRYTTVGSGLRMHYLDEGPRNGRPVVCLHGEPSWSFLYRKMLPPLMRAGYRVLAPDLIGFGRSDKPAATEDYTYQRHVDWITDWFLQLDLSNCVLFCQDWGGLIGLRLALDHPDRFAAIAAANTFLPAGQGPMPAAFEQWRQYSQTVPEFPVGMILQRATVTELPAEVVAAYDAPFPDESYKAGARIFPSLVPSTPEEEEARKNLVYLQKLQSWTKPFLTLFSDQDPITRGGDRYFQQIVPGAAGQPHRTIADGGHFLQEDQGPLIAEHLIEFLNKLNA